MSYKVITHDGKAHMDELLAIALLSYYRECLPEEITRINPNEAANLIDTDTGLTDTYFIDCGLKFNPDKLQFDHHQSKDLDSSALLIFNTLLPELHNTELHNYIKLVSKIDTQGLYDIKGLSLNSEASNYLSFSQRLILKEFEKSPMEIVSIFYNGIYDLIDFNKKKEEAAKWLKSKNNITISNINDIRVLIYNIKPPEDITRALKSADQEIIESENIDIIYNFDRENDKARVLYRTLGGHNKIDFTKAEVKNTIFCHLGGFLLKFIPSDEDHWKVIINNAIV